VFQTSPKYVVPRICLLQIWNRGVSRQVDGFSSSDFFIFFQVTENKLLTIAGMDKWVDNN
jgi:hypothetical protein